MMKLTEDCCFSKIEAARYLSRSARWLDYQLTGPNPPPGFQVPSAKPDPRAKKQKKVWLFKKSELDRWLEQFRAGSDLDRIVDEVVSEVAGNGHAHP
jgi:hypothetical protein